MMKTVRRFLLLCFGLSLMMMFQMMLMPKWLPIGFMPDFPLLIVLLVSFWKPNAFGFWLGLLLGSFQGWLHGTGWWAFALSRGFASTFASWLRVQWLWQSPLAAGFCAALGTVFAEILLALFLTLSERNLSPFVLLPTILAFEIPFNALFAFAISHVAQMRRLAV